MKCLLIETKDSRKFFTQEKNLPQLIEFSKKFCANISLVNMIEGEVLSLDKLVLALCNSKYKNQANYVLIEKKINNKSKNKSIISSKIKTAIRKKFISKKIVNIKELKNKYEKYGFSEKVIFNYIEKIKNDLECQGFNFVKINDEYKIS
jgi:hypothetical protein